MTAQSAFGCTKIDSKSYFENYMELLLLTFQVPEQPMDICEEPITQQTVEEVESEMPPMEEETPEMVRIVEKS